jgi:glutamine kinase
MKHQSKARTLEALSPGLTRFTVPGFRYFAVSEWRARHRAICDEISQQFSGRTLIVRSSASDEDGAAATRAGEYDSVLNVASDDASAIATAVNTVIDSYSRHGARGTDDEVIVQEMLQRTVMSGVVFTHDLNTGAPYYVINYDDISGRTDTVTSGAGEYANRTLYVHRSAIDAVRSARFQSLLGAIQELEVLMGSQFLDVEFALAEDLTPHLLQVRAITTQPNWNRATTRRIDAALAGIQGFASARFKPMPGVYGRTTVLGQMPDWNPAEMIGRAPRALALSLYRAIITDTAWRDAREMMGYDVPVGQPLMVSLAGQPFIDTRLSFHSYLPAGLPRSTCEKLVDVWVERLREHPELHDKVEFDIAITTYSFDIDEKIDRLAGGTLNADERNEFKRIRQRQTLSWLRDDTEGGIAAALKKLAHLSAKQSADEGGASLWGLHKMLNDCVRFGSTPFSVLARHGFVARTLLHSLCRRGVFSTDDVHRFQASIRTVASDLVNDLRRLQAGSMQRRDFMRRYGHLRPGTYDILSQRYDQMDSFGASDTSARHSEAPAEFSLTAGQRKAVDGLLFAEGFDGIDADRLFDYIREATVGREYGKFVFTRTLSDILEGIAEFGEHHGLSRNEMSHVPLRDILDVALSSVEGGIENRLRDLAEANAESHALSAAIRLPQVLFDEAGVHVVPFQVSQPNFITDRSVAAPSVLLGVGQTPDSLDGKIVLIENADPGFDWIFAHRIAGLVTKFGGANSHMAIRCAEFSIPAAIGCGEQRFEALLQTDSIMIDCAAGFIQTSH